MRAKKVLVSGAASGQLLRLVEPVSFWGGVSSDTGVIVDADHPQKGAAVTGTVLAMPHARGSSGTSSGFADLIRSGLGPAAVVLESADMMLTVGAAVAGRLYGTTIPVVVADLPANAQGLWQVNGEFLEGFSS